MTVNIGLVTSDALVLGCDSVASTSEYFLDPSVLEWEKDANGKFVQDQDGKFSLRFGYRDMRPQVTNAWGGVTKMFQLHGRPSPAVGVTAGLAKLQDRTIASHAAEFFLKCEARQKKLVSVKTICDEFLKFMRRRYLAHYQGASLPPSFREGPEFLVGGFGRDDKFPSLFRISVQENTVRAEFESGATGLAWNGQADAVERFIRGYDSVVRAYAESALRDALQAQAQKMQTYMTELVNKVLDRLQQPLPQDLEIKPPDPDKVALDWGQFRVPIDYANLPLQEAISFVSAMVMSQASKARFAVGIPTVGGRTHVGVITKAAGFQILNEPPLSHRYTGFSDDV